MSDVIDEFTSELTRLQRKYADQPDREIIRLFLLALEREELVAIAYRESMIHWRLQAMPLDEEVREMIRHALVWIWKNEEMHAIYIRGALLKLGNPGLRLHALLQQVSGGLAGWAGSALQHSRWGQAPLSRSLAMAIAAVGTLLGKVPKSARQHLQFGPLRHFCQFNIEAERTAWLCWDRLATLLEQTPDRDPELRREVAEVKADEARHEQIFTILAAVLDDRDRLVEGETATSLAEKIRAVGEFYLPRAWRHVSGAENPLGSGGRVWSICGHSDGDKCKRFRRLLDEAGLHEQIGTRSQFLDKPVEALKVAIKPTFMLGYHHRDRSPLTDPALLEELARYLQGQGCADVAVIEGQNVYDRFYQHRTVHDVAAYFNIRSPHFRMVDAATEQVPHDYARGMAQYTIARTWKEADFRISFSKLRSHPIELALLTIGNVEWVGARCDEFIFIERQANRATAVMMLLDEFPPHFALIDAYDQTPDGLVGVMGSAHPPSPRRLYAGVDGLAVDTVAARHLGMKDPRDSSLLQAACHWFGGWSGPIEVVGTDEPIADWRGPYHNEISAILSALAYPMYVMGSGRGSLFVPAMDETAFPPIAREGRWLRLGRRGIRALLGLPQLD
ncbi:DUF362 domain-containing protein [Candidatus Entotheonella palauensis]|uniref:DUF362 domain-containing protein n=1 Tax=Candidatus Entotheonella gemina TaxID=1429439 RepID=W4M3T3_9BACT|nr:DUF362 domain-containing protein [Candidatus Entotheonella palauensis]ETX05019.1 MAG: hypothetical protein ETSY2_25395 [Candidatus Entotheonella gemina]